MPSMQPRQTRNGVPRGKDGAGGATRKRRRGEDSNKKRRPPPLTVSSGTEAGRGGKGERADQGTRTDETRTDETRESTHTLATGSSATGSSGTGSSGTVVGGTVGGRVGRVGRVLVVDMAMQGDETRPRADDETRAAVAIDKLLVLRPWSVASLRDRAWRGLRLCRGCLLAAVGWQVSVVVFPETTPGGEMVECMYL